jgi:formylglycine-generating enzyme required for sulfatase activity
VAAEVPVTGITLEPATLEMLVEATYSLTATVLPDDATHQTLTWTSSAPDIATVADGLVTAVAVGSTTITVATANGKTADCEVTVDYIVETVLIPAGTFLMGSSDGSNTGSGMPNVDVNATPDEPNRIPYFEQQHRVTLTKDYYMSRYEITNAQYAAFLNDAGVGSNGKKPDIQDGQTLISISGSYNWCLRWSGNRWESIVGYANHPAIFVSWYGAKAYAEWAGGNLPTEAQWERAARGSAENMPFGIGSDRALTADIANFNGYYPYSFDSGGESFDGFTGSHLNRTSAVGSYSPNAYVLYDMHGNAREWCLDKWDGSDNYAGLPDTDPLCTEGSSCVLRGGGWDSYSNPCRSAYRQRAIPGTCINNAGFRIVFIAD